jgi:chromosome segregation ATPase
MADPISMALTIAGAAVSGGLASKLVDYYRERGKSQDKRAEISQETRIDAADKLRALLEAQAVQAQERERIAQQRYEALARQFQDLVSRHGALLHEHEVLKREFHDLRRHVDVLSRQVRQSEPPQINLEEPWKS